MILGPDLMADDGVKAAVNFYGDWYKSDSKLYFVVENLDRLQQAERRQ